MSPVDLTIACSKCEQFREENQLLRRKLRIAQMMLSKKHKLRVCREIRRRDPDAQHLCGLSLPRTIRRRLADEPCRPLPEVGAGAIQLMLCEYLRLAYLIDKAQGECWLWQGSKYNVGYGLFVWAGQRWPAHRFVYTLFVGVIPFGLVLDHTCRQKACVNPEHLEPVTQGENVRRGKRPIAVPAID
jgi:hypothetical protein